MSKDGPMPTASTDLHVPMTIGEAIGMIYGEAVAVFFPGEAEIDKTGNAVVTSFILEPMTPELIAQLSVPDGNFSMDREIGIKVCQDAIEKVRGNIQIDTSIAILIKNRDVLADGDYARAIQSHCEKFIFQVLKIAWNNAPLSKFQFA